jgi:hypothetical protein
MVMGVSVYRFLHCGRRLYDRIPASLFFVYALYGIIRYVVLAYFHATTGIVIDREEALLINLLSQIKEMYMAIVATFILLNQPKERVISSPKQGEKEWIKTL